MALPKLNALPQYEVKIPSTGKSVKYRPFLVKEQKVLLMALETKDQRSIYNAMFNVIEACLEGAFFLQSKSIEDGTDVNSLTTYDIEYLFVMIRSKSVGENIDLRMICLHDGCETPTPVAIPIDDLKAPVVQSKTKIVELTTDISLELEHPSISRVQEVALNVDTNQTEVLLQLMKAAIKTVRTEDERIVFKEETESEQNEFIDNLNTQQLNEIMKFVQEIPAMQHDVEWTCTGCGKHNKRTLRGLSDFFS